MAEPFLSEIRIFSFDFAPKGWALCNGQLLPIAQNQALFSLLGTTYGGDGQVNFALPDLRGRVPMHEGGGHTLGERSGAEADTITTNTLASHDHVLQATANPADNRSPDGNVYANADVNAYRSPAGATLLAMNNATLTAVGGGQPHANMSPFLTLNFCIALQGIFPSLN